MTDKTLAPAVEGLFTMNPDEPRLLGTQCRACGTYFFPEYSEQHRPGCSREGVEKVLLSNEGKLASYTVMHYMPPLPFKTDRDITPYPIGLVEFPEGIQITGLMVGCEPHELKVGKEVETTTFTLHKNEDGQDVVTWAFRLSNT